MQQHENREKDDYIPEMMYILVNISSYTGKELVCCQCVEEGEDEAGWSRS